MSASGDFVHVIPVCVSTTGLECKGKETITSLGNQPRSAVGDAGRVQADEREKKTSAAEERN